MPEIELQKHTMNLYRGDYEKLQQLYPEAGAAAVIRRIVRKFVQSVEKQGTETPDVSIKL